MTVVLLGRDLMIASRIIEAAATAGADLLRLEDPAQLPPADEVRLLLVDWGDRRPGWGEALGAWRTGVAEPMEPRVLLFGPHTDLAAHAAARAAGLGPMLARSKLLADLRTLFD